MTGPYFTDQQPSSCGHYYPDTLRLRDEKREDGTYIRITDCKYCGRGQFQLDPNALDEELVRELDRKGFSIGIREGEIEKMREKAFKRILSS